MNDLMFKSLIERMIQQESGGNPNAVSPTGASGLMQIMPQTASDPGYGVKPMPWENRFDPVENRAFGESYMRSMLDKFGGDQERALVGYNWGPGNAGKWSGNRSDLPPETQGYLRNILDAKKMGGETGHLRGEPTEYGGLLDAFRNGKKANEYGEDTENLWGKENKYASLGSALSAAGESPGITPQNVTPYQPERRDNLAAYFKLFGGL